MAKSSKLEDYWRQNNIESLFRELTHNIAQRMPPDPAVAIVQHLQKKFPKSFRTPIDNNDNNTGIISKTMATNLQLSITSPRTDVNIKNKGDIEMQRRASNQNQVGDMVTIPTAGSAFTDLLKKDTSDSNQAPDLNLRNLMFANRITQQIVRSGKDIKSDRDILEEELIQPMQPKENVSSTTAANASVRPTPEDLQHAQTREQPSAAKLLEFKQQMHTEKNYRSIHRNDLAEIAKKARIEEQTAQSDLFENSAELKQNNLDNDDGLAQTVPKTTNTKPIHKPIPGSQQEENILDDENIFEPRRTRTRERHANKVSIPRANTPTAQRLYTRDLGSTLQTNDANLKPIMQFCVCKVCGNIVSDDQNQSKVYSQQVSAAPTTRSVEPQKSTQSVTTSDVAVDDWFESPSDVSSSRQAPPPTHTNPFQRNLFQPINDNNTNILRSRSPPVPLIVTDEEAKSRRSTTSRMSESDVFIRTPEPKSRRLSSPRNMPSPVTKKHQTDTLAVTNQQLSKTMVQPSRSQPVPSPTLSATIVPTTQRRMSGWSVREHSPDLDGN